MKRAPALSFQAALPKNLRLVKCLLIQHPVWSPDEQTSIFVKLNLSGKL